MTKSNKQDELSEALLRWAEEDEGNRSVLVLADDESGTRLVYNGSGANLANALANAMLQDKGLRAVCAGGMLIYRNNKANDDDKEGIMQD